MPRIKVSQQRNPLSRFYITEVNPENAFLNYFRVEYHHPISATYFQWMHNVIRMALLLIVKGMVDVWVYYPKCLWALQVLFSNHFGLLSRCFITEIRLLIGDWDRRRLTSGFIFTEQTFCFIVRGKTRSRKNENA